MQAGTRAPGCPLSTETLRKHAYARSFHTLFSVLIGKWPDHELPNFNEEGNVNYDAATFFCKDDPTDRL